MATSTPHEQPAADCEAIRRRMGALLFQAVFRVSVDAKLPWRRNTTSAADLQSTPQHCHCTDISLEIKTCQVLVTEGVYG